MLLVGITASDIYWMMLTGVWCVNGVQRPLTRILLEYISTLIFFYILFNFFTEMENVRVWGLNYGRMCSRLGALLWFKMLFFFSIFPTFTHNEWYFRKYYHQYDLLIVIVIVKTVSRASTIYCNIWCGWSESIDVCIYFFLWTECRSRHLFDILKMLKLLFKPLWSFNSHERLSRY